MPPGSNFSSVFIKPHTIIQHISITGARTPLILGGLTASSRCGAPGRRRLIDRGGYPAFNLSGETVTARFTVWTLESSRTPPPLWLCKSICRH